MTWIKNFIYKLFKRSYYIRYEWTNDDGHRIMSWNILETGYNLLNAKNLLSYIREQEKSRKDFYLTYIIEIK